MNKLIKIIAIASALTLLFSACREKETSSATIKADSMEIPGDAGDYTLSFSIDGYVSGVPVEAKADVDWITINNVQQGAEGKVEFSATQNDSSPREGRITLSYEGAQDKVVYVDQMTYGVDPDAAFKIDVQVLSPKALTINVSIQVRAREGTDQQAVQQAVEEAVRRWFSGERLGNDVLRAQLGSVIYGCENVENYVILSPAADQEVELDQLPTLGTLTVEAMP